MLPIHVCRTTRLAVPVLLAGLLLGGPARALTFDVTGQSYGSDVSAQVELTWDGTDTLTVEITNTSNATAVVTGFAFNVPGAVTGVSAFSASGTLDDDEWQALFAPGNAPGGYGFEGGAGTGNNIAGGHPNDGFGNGVTATFTFTFTGSGLAALTENDFLGEFVDGAAGPTDFGVRFQAIPTGPGSDFAIQVPAPGAAALVGLTLIALARRRLA